MKARKTFENLSRSKQDRITQAAISEFSEKGYTGASINALVDNLGIAKGSIFQYFGDKKGLFLFIFEKSTELVKGRLRVIRDQTTEDKLFSRLEKTLHAGVYFLKDHPLIYKLYMKVLFDSKIPFRDEILLSLRNYSFQYLRSLLETAQKNGELREDLDLDKACFILDAVMDRFLQTQTIRHLDAGLGIYQADEKKIKSWITDIVEIVNIGIGAEGKKH
ncbi:MAG: TetR/AcrR family transcriptional regulator [Desulfobacterales bacterium]